MKTPNSAGLDTILQALGLAHAFVRGDAGADDDLRVQGQTLAAIEEAFEALGEPAPIQCIVCEQWEDARDLESTFCGSIHPDGCPEMHARECGVCREDFLERGLLGPDDRDA